MSIADPQQVYDVMKYLILAGIVVRLLWTVVPNVLLTPDPYSFVSPTKATLKSN